MAALGLLAAACQSPAARPPAAVAPVPPARITITTGNLRFSAPAGATAGGGATADPITVVGSPVKGTWGDGWTIWFLSWRKLVAGSATHEMVVVDASGSRLAPAQVALPSSLRLPARPDPAGWRQAPHGGP